MRRTGGLVALAAGICGVEAAMITLIVAGAFANHAPWFALLEWRGVVFSVITIVLGAICICTGSQRAVVLLLADSLAGVVLNGTLVSIWMLIAFIGGLLAAAGSSSKPSPGKLAA